MTDDQFKQLVDNVQQLTTKTDTLADSIATVDTKVERVKYLSKLFDVNVKYPAENDILVYDKTGKWKNIQYDEVGFEPGEGGESYIYLIGTDDDTAPTNENTYSAARINEDRLNKASESGDSMNGNLTMVKGTTIYVDSIQSHDASQSTDSGSGLIYNINSSGDSYIEVDSLCVRKAALFNQLEIKKITSVGGSLVISPASNTIIRVEEVSELYNGSYQNVYRCYYRNNDDDNKESIVTDFQAGDFAKIQSFNLTDTGLYEESQNRFYWGKVLGVGSNSYGGYIDLSKTDVHESTNTTPRKGDSLVMYGNATNISRQNIIDITSYGNNAPSITMYQNVNTYDTTNKAIIEMGYDPDQSQQQAYMNIYGRLYVGTKDESTSYIKYDPTANNNKGELTVKAIVKILPTSTIDNGTSEQTIISGGKISTGLLNASEIVANAGTIKNQLQVGSNFKVDASGNMTATNVNLTGTINATSGTFSNNITFGGKLSGPTGTLGGFTINANSISSNNLTISPTGITYNNSGNTVQIMANENAAGMNISTSSSIPALYLYNNKGLSLQIANSVEVGGINGFGTLVPAVSAGASGNVDISNNAQFHGIRTVYLFNQSGVTYLLPKIQYYVEALGLPQNSVYGDRLSFFTIFGTNINSSLTGSGNGEAYEVTGGNGVGLSDRPNFIHSQDTGAVQSSITLDNFSLSLYLAELYYNNDWCMTFRFIAGSR